MMFFTLVNSKGEPLRQRRALGQGGNPSHQLDLVFGPFNPPIASETEKEFDGVGSS